MEQSEQSLDYCSVVPVGVLWNNVSEQWNNDYCSGTVTVCIYLVF